jgi:hypothetical protein
MKGKDSLTNIVKDLLQKGYEGTYWDYKEDYTDCAEDKLMDIICMANNIDGRDAYLIYGASDTGKVRGIENTKYARYTSKSLTEFLRTKPFAGEYVPHVTVEVVNIENHQLDIVIIHKSRFVPFYLREDFGNNPQLNKRLRAGAIYVRVNDVNTPRNSTARFEHTELLWRRRFGIDLKPYEKMLLMLDKPSDWMAVRWDIDKRSYNVFNPEYQIIIEDSNCGYETLRFFYDDETMHYAPLKLMYLNTVLYETEIWFMDMGRCLIPKPESNVMIKEHIRYYYFERDSVNGKLLPIFAYEKFICNNRSGLQMPVLLFENFSEREEYEDWVRNNIMLKDNIIKEIQDNAIFQHIQYKECRDGQPEFGILEIAVSFAFYKKWKERSSFCHGTF